MIKKIALLVSILFLSGCAQWETMTPQQKNVVIGTAIASAAIGILISEDNINHLHDEFNCRGNCSNR